MNGQTMNNNGRDGQNVGDNQLGWQQFSDQIRQRENERVEYLEECRFNRRDEQDAKFVDVEVSTPRRQASSSSGGGGARRAVVKFQLAAPTVVEEDTTTTTTSHYEVVQKPKTRAARRAMEEEEDEEDMTPTVNPSPKRERRSDYWVQQNDKRRSAARNFKMTSAAAME
jgi:hypothetical protein